MGNRTREGKGKGRERGMAGRVTWRSSVLAPSPSSPHRVIVATVQNLYYVAGDSWDRKKNREKVANAV